MLDIKDIAKYYDNSQYVSPRHILREYLQYKILDLFVDSKIGNKISFLGELALESYIIVLDFQKIWILIILIYLMMNLLKLRRQ